MEAAEKREKERKKAEEKEKLKRLHKIIEEEKSKSHRDGHKKKQYVMSCMFIGMCVWVCACGYVRVGSACGYVCACG